MTGDQGLVDALAELKRADGIIEINMNNTVTLAREVRRLWIENEALRTALSQLASLGEQGMKPDYGEWLTFHDKVAQIARVALRPLDHQSAGEASAESSAADGPNNGHR